MGFPVAVWDRTAVERVIAADPNHCGTDAETAVRNAAESDEVAELLGNHARIRNAGNAVVNYSIHGVVIPGGFVTRDDIAATLGEQRRRVFEMAFSEPVRMEIRQKPAASYSLAQRSLATRLQSAEEKKMGDPEFRAKVFQKIVLMGLAMCQTKPVRHAPHHPPPSPAAK